MKQFLLVPATIILSIFLFFPVKAQLTFNAGQSAQQLVNALTGPGLIGTNATSPSVNAATFINNGVNGFSLTGGIILSTGMINVAIDTPGWFASTDINLAGDPLLDQLVSPLTTYDVSSLEFDFVAANDSVEFNFVFASEEYNEYVNTPFNDIFGFFITGPGYQANTNVALLPGSNTPITISSINNGGPYSGAASGPCMNCQYYVDNAGTGAVDLCYDGYTTVINIKFPVWPCSNYHFKIAIGDVGDGVFDSAVFLEENSFVACPLMEALQHGTAAGNTISICQGGTATLTAPPGAVYSWSTGETTQSILVTQPGVYSFFITDPVQPSCFAVSGAVNVVQAGTIQTPVITQNINILSAPNVIPAPGMTWQWSLDGVAIPGATQSTLTIAANGCYRVTLYEGTCESTSNEICVTNTSLYEVQSDLIKISPNPLINSSVIETPFTDGSLTTLKLKDISGREVLSQIHSSHQINLEKGSLRSGIYFLEISNNDYQGSIVRKIVVL